MVISGHFWRKRYIYFKTKQNKTKQKSGYILIFLHILTVSWQHIYTNKSKYGVLTDIYPEPE